MPAISLVPPINTARGTWFLSDYASLAVQPHPREQIGIGTVGVGYFFADHFSLSAEVLGASVAQPGRDAGVGGGDLLLRGHFLNGNGWTVFSDVAGGIWEADTRLPPGGTDFNFTIRTGLGAMVRLTDHMDLLVGARYFHLSNAHQEGPARNPSINAIEGYLGFVFPL